MATQEEIIYQQIQQATRAAENRLAQANRKVAQLQQEAQVLAAKVPTGDNTFNFLSGVGVLFWFTPRNLPLNLAAAANGRISLDVESGKDFMCYQINGVVWDKDGETPAYVAAPHITLELTTTEFSQGHQNEPIHWMTVIGEAQHPAYLPVPLVLSGGTVANFRLVNLSADEYDIYLTLVGILRYGRVRA